MTDEPFRMKKEDFIRINGVSRRVIWLDYLDLDFFAAYPKHRALPYAIVGKEGARDDRRIASMPITELVDTLHNLSNRVIVTQVEYRENFEDIRVYQFAVISNFLAGTRVDYIVAEGVTEADRLHAALVCDLMIAAIPRPLKIFIAYDTERTFRWAAKHWPCVQRQTALQGYLEQRSKAGAKK